MSIDMESKIRQQAEEQGLEADNEINRRLIQDAARAYHYQSAPRVILSTLTPEEFLQSSQELVERAKARNLPVSTSSFRREDIYDDDEGR